MPEGVKLSPRRIKGILIQEVYLTLRSVEVIMDIIVFPIMSVILFGFLTTYLSGSNQEISRNVMLGILLWQVVYITQYSVSMNSIWNIWSRNLTNLFITPLLVRELFVASMMSAIIKAFIIFSLSSVLSAYIFNFNIFDVGILPLILVYLSLSIFSFSIGVAIAGLIFRLGTKIQAFAWGLLPMLQPLMAAIYPVEVLPRALQVIAYVFPTTFAFEAIRFSMKTGQINWQLLGMSLIVNLVWLVVSCWIFNFLFKKSKETGQFARNEG